MPAPPPLAAVVSLCSLTDMLPLTLLSSATCWAAFESFAVRMRGDALQQQPASASIFTSSAVQQCNLSSLRTLRCTDVVHCGARRWLLQRKRLIGLRFLAPIVGVNLVEVAHWDEDPRSFTGPPSRAEVGGTATAKCTALVPGGETLLNSSVRTPQSIGLPMAAKRKRVAVLHRHRAAPRVHVGQGNLRHDGRDR